MPVVQSWGDSEYVELGRGLGAKWRRADRRVASCAVVVVEGVSVGRTPACERTSTPSWNGYTVTFETGMPVVGSHVPGGVRVVCVPVLRVRLVRACLYHGRSAARTRGRMTADACQRLVGFGRMRRRMERMFAERVRHGRLPSSAAELASESELTLSSSSRAVAKP